MKGHVTLMSKASDEWATPQAFFDVVDADYHFTVDAAATTENTKCVTYYSNALEHAWGFGQTIWLNPPYSRIGEFMDKAVAESAMNTVVCLVPARTDTKWWHRTIEQATRVRLIKGRLRFGGGDSCAPFPSALVTFRPWLKDGMGPDIVNWDWRAK